VVPDEVLITRLRSFRSEAGVLLEGILEEYQLDPVIHNLQVGAIRLTAVLVLRLRKLEEQCELSYKCQPMFFLSLGSGAGHATVMCQTCLGACAYCYGDIVVRCARSKWNRRWRRSRRPDCTLSHMRRRYDSPRAMGLLPSPGFKRPTPIGRRIASFRASSLLLSTTTRQSLCWAQPTRRSPTLTWTG
jgi:hypothetical protein